MAGVSFKTPDLSSAVNPQRCMLRTAGEVSGRPVMRWKWKRLRETEAAVRPKALSWALVFGLDGAPGEMGTGGRAVNGSRL